MSSCNSSYAPIKYLLDVALSIRTFLFTIVLICAMLYPAAAAVPPTQLELSTQAQQALDTIASDQDKLDYLLKTSGSHRWQSSTIALAELALDIAAHSEQSNLIGQAYHIFGLYYFYNDDLSSAIDHLQKALSSELSPLKQAEVRSALGGSYGKLGNYPMAIDQQLRAKGIFENQLANDPTTTSAEVQRAHATLLNSMANIAQRIEEYSQAGIYYDEAYAIFLALKNKRAAAVVLGNKGEMLNATKHFSQALSDLKKAAALKKDINASPQSQAMTTHNMASALVGLGRIEEAIPLFSETISIFTEANHKSGLAYSHTDLGFAYLQLGRFQQAYHHCKAGNEFALHASDLEYQERSYQCLYMATKSLGNTAEALTMHEAYLVRKDSNMNESNVRRITQLEMQYEFDQEARSQEMTRLAQERKSRNVIATLGLFIAALLVISYLIYRGLIQKRREQKILAEKNLIISQSLAEKNTLIKEIHHRVKNNLQVISSLLSLQSRHVQDPDAVRLLKESRNRVMAMAMIHQNLYETENLKSIDLKPYIEQLVRKLFSSYNIQPSHIKLELRVDELRLEVDTVISMGLIINELITNSLKHAFQDGRSGTITVSLYERDDVLHLKVADNGVGIADHSQALHSSFGYEIVRALNNKLKADMDIDGDSGLAVTLHIHNYTKVA